MSKTSLIFSVALLLAGCSITPNRSTIDVESTQSMRETALADALDFTVRGRLAVSNGDDGGSGSFVWQQQGEQVDFTLNVPLSSTQWHLVAVPGNATLSDNKDHHFAGFTAEELLLAHTGWRVPVAQLRYWMLGLRAPGQVATLSLDSNGLPKQLQQDGWQIDYRSYMDSEPRKPNKVFAQRGKDRVRVSVRAWE
jgi:outer membrane lipoprotein LolB